MKIYTKTGDQGETGLLGGPRVRKDDPRIEAYGTVDELNAVLGVARTGKMPADVDALLMRIQNQLFDLGAELATPDPSKLRGTVIGASHVAEMENAIDDFDAELEPLRQFILPGGTRTAAELHLARTTCRRAERLVVTLAATAPVSTQLVIYLNRLSDLLFVLARAVNKRANYPDVPWQKTS